MSLGDYDETEHERRERKNSHIDADFEDRRVTYQGKIEHEGEETAEELLDMFDEIKSE